MLFMQEGSSIKEGGFLKAWGSRSLEEWMRQEGIVSRSVRNARDPELMMMGEKLQI